VTGRDKSRVGAGREIGRYLCTIEDSYLVTVAKALPGAGDSGEARPQNHNAHG